MRLSAAAAAGVLLGTAALAAAQTCDPGWKWDGKKCIVDTLGADCPNGVNSVSCSGIPGERVNGTLVSDASMTGKVECWRIECPGYIAMEFVGEFKTGCRMGEAAKQCTDGNCNTYEVRGWTQEGALKSHTATGCGGWGIADSPPRFGSIRPNGAVIRMDTSVQPTRPGKPITMRWSAAAPETDAPAPTPECPAGWAWSGVQCQPATLGADCPAVEKVKCTTKGTPNKGTITVPADQSGVKRCWSIECGGYVDIDLGSPFKTGCVDMPPAAQECTDGRCNTLEVRGWTREGGVLRDHTATGCGGWGIADSPPTWSKDLFPNGAVVRLDTTKQPAYTGDELTLTWTCTERGATTTTATCDPSKEPEGLPAVGGSTEAPGAEDDSPSSGDTASGSASGSEEEEDRATFIWIAFVVLLAFIIVGCLLGWYYFRWKKSDDGDKDAAHTREPPTEEPNGPYEEMGDDEGLPPPRYAQTMGIDHGYQAFQDQSRGASEYSDAGYDFAGGCEVEFQCGREWRAAEIVQTLPGGRVVVESGAMRITLPMNVVRKRVAPAPPVSEAQRHCQAESPSRFHAGVHKVVAY